MKWITCLKRRCGWDINKPIPDTNVASLGENGQEDEFQSKFAYL